ncbi:TonB-dependent receptor [Rhodanobacter sp. MP7CTX1]|uniref:TonB-dependent receptor plug domain-containing protein n=1 Tax=Rhodanobacter sp. MP7CTX1 TaxID=2723084 RepID=UPI00160D83A9|nr:TonB-dependent receptor [Rhodanobacter sp. MP7CTX1]MBB6189604.1 outer membrane receptor protein involved in Fe transport [Rhodanobacter sp. MP7CTX1]
MKLGVKKLSSAVQLALSLGAVIAVGASSTAFAQDQSAQPQGNTNPSAPQKASTLQTVVVTGSHIRRVDLETASPVVTIDRAAIQASGKLTLGDLVQDLPAVTGGNTNPQVNNSGGTGASSIGLRGLGPNRTLILVDGHRVNNTDPNSIPASMIDHIDVLTTGASSVYGSDAVGGVVNFILRKDYQGAEFSTNFGQSDHNDGEQQGYSFTFGQTSDKGSIMGGVDYNKTDGIEAGNRKFSRNSVSIYGTNGTGPSAPQPPTANVGGSSSAPNGHVQLKGSNFAAAFPGCTSGYVAHNAGTTDTLSPASYHCFQNNGPNSDKYNFATVNLILTPQERTNAFLMGTYNLTDHVSAYLDLYVDKTSSNAALAPDPLTTLGGFQISQNNYYNPFGVNYQNGQSAFGVRLTSLGLREQFFGLTTGQVHTGFKGDFPIGNQTWQWDVGLDYGHTTTTETTTGLVNLNILNQAAGPSFNNGGTVVCGTPAVGAQKANIIAGCIPFNPFNINTPQSIASLQAAASPGLITSLTQEKVWHADFNGGVFDLPAGTVNLAVGADYRQEYEDQKVDGLLQINPVTGTCTLGSQCSSALQGGYNVKEVYAEAFFPILNDLPFVKSLNVDIGDRYSKFNLFGTTNNLKFAIEYKPFDDLLLRGTMAEVFRAPNLAEVFGAPTSSAYRISSDPCTGYTGTPVNPACVNVKTDGSFVNTLVTQNLQGNGIVSGAEFAGFPIKPEKGKTFDFGAVYSPSWAPGLSSTIDFWHLYLNNVITVVGVQSELDLCAAGDTTFCKFISRETSGVNQGQLSTQTLQPTGNLGTTSTGGVDFSLNYKLPEFSFGKFSVGMNATYLKYFNEQTAPGSASNTTYNDAGHFMPFGSAQAAACPGASGNCLFPRWKGQGYVNWQLGNWDASWRLRYIGRFQMGSANPTQDVLPYGTCSYDGQPNPAGGTYQCTIRGAELKYGATVYNDVSLGYNIEPLNTRVEFGVNNLFDKQPPLLYANNTLNANTDPSDFDLIGRFFFGRVTVKF